MKKRALSALLCLALCFALAGQAAAAEGGVSFTVNGTPLAEDVRSYAEDGITYVSYGAILFALYPDATAVWANGRAEVTAEGLTMYLKPGAKYIEANGRCLYVPGGLRSQDGMILVPVRTLCQALGAEAVWDSATGTVNITAVSGPIVSGDSYYDAEDLDLLSRLIYAESGNQPLEGKIAVGNVVLNRVASPLFPNTVADVIYQPNQFSPAGSGHLSRTPNAESVVAAKLCLEGANTAGNALYFVNPVTSPGSWASRNRPYVATIGAHAFYA